MDDDDWQALDGPDQRLRWARLRWQRKAGAAAATAENAAESLGMKGGTYRTYERPPGSSKHTPLQHQAAIQFGRRFKVSWTWLLTGEGTPFDDQLPTEQERVVSAMSQLSTERQKVLADMIEAFARNGTNDSTPDVAPAPQMRRQGSK